MNAMFKEIRHGDIEKIRVRIAKNPAVVNEIFTGTKPKKDIGQSPLQVAIKCGQFEIIELLLEYNADPDFMENRTDQPADTKDYYFRPMPLLHDTIHGVFHSLPYGEFERAEKYVKLIGTLLERGANSNKKTYPHPISGHMASPIYTAVVSAHEVLSQFSTSTYELNIRKYDAAKKHLFQVLDLLIKYGADFDDWADNESWGNETCRTVFLGDYIPKEDKPHEIKWRGKIIKGVTRGDPARDIREALQEYIKKK
ncbi:MAG: ankyrin repeat domain-containing protein [Lachnospiraceae bacterium]|nr:ankyrin repeat domain-containing protein [Lachnospiraceae bacterium]